MDLEAVVAAFDGGVIRFFDAAGRKVATSTFGSPAFSVAGGKALSLPLKPDPNGAIGGTVRYAVMYAKDGRQTGRIECGGPESHAAIRLDSVEVPKGGEVQCAIRVQASIEAAVRAAVTAAVKPQVMGRAVVIRKADKEKAALAAASGKGNPPYIPPREGECDVAQTGRFGGRPLADDERAKAYGVKRAAEEDGPTSEELDKQ